MPDRMTAKEVADYLGVHLDTVYRMTRRREIPFFNVGRRKFFSKSSIDNWIEEQEQNAITKEAQVSSF